MTVIEELTSELRDFVSQRGWDVYHDPKNLVMLVLSEAGELAAEYRWVSNASADTVVDDPAARARIAEELGDVCIALLLLCDRTGIDFADAVRAKLRVNAQRYPASGQAIGPDRQ